MRNLGLKVMGTAFALVLSTGVFAQEENHKGHPEKKQSFEKHLVKMKEDLELTPEQVEKIKAMHAENQKQIEVINKEKLTADERHEKMKSIHEKEREDMKKVLNDEQLEKMKAMRKKHKKAPEPQKVSEEKM